MKESNMKMYRAVIDTEDEGRAEVVVLAEDKPKTRKLLCSKSTLKNYPVLRAHTIEKITEIPVSSKAKIVSLFIG